MERRTGWIAEGKKERMEELRDGRKRRTFWRDRIGERDKKKKRRERMELQRLIHEEWSE